MDYTFALSASGRYIHVVPTRPADSEGEILRRWSAVMELGRKEQVYKVLFDHRQCPPPTNIDLISVVLKHPEWKPGERWRIALLVSAQLANAARLHLEAVAEFVAALQQEAAVFWELDQAEQWLIRDPG